MGLDVSRVQALASIARHEAVKDAVNDGRITQKQALAIGQGIPAGETELATELVGAVENPTPQEARSVVREAKRTPITVPVPERVRQARGTVSSAAFARSSRTTVSGSDWMARPTGQGKKSSSSTGPHSVWFDRVFRRWAARIRGDVAAGLRGDRILASAQPRAVRLRYADAAQQVGEHAGLEDVGDVQNERPPPPE